MRVFVYFTYGEYHSIRKWMQRHPEYEGAIFSNDGFYIAKFDIDATDPQKVAYFFNYFMGKNVEIFKPKKLNLAEVLRNYEIVSYKPFTAYPRHDARNPPNFFATRKASGQPSQPSLGIGEEKSSPSVLEEVEI